MTPLRFMFACSLACCGAVALFGCQASHKSQAADESGMSAKVAPTTRHYSSELTAPPSDPHKQAYWTEQPVGIGQPSTPVAQGPTPLVHLFDVGGPIRVVDAESRAVVATATVPDHAIVSVDDRRGVTVGRTNVLPGPLPAGHQYILYVEPTTPGVMRQGVGPPAPLRQK